MRALRALDERGKGICLVAAGAAPPIADKPAFKTYLKGLKQHAADLKMRLDHKDMSYLEQLGPVAPDAIAWYGLDVHSCPQCRMTHTLRVTQFKKKVEGKKSKTETSEKEVLRQLLLSISEVDALRKLKEKNEALIEAKLNREDEVGENEDETKNR